MPTRRANATWSGELQGGNGEFSGESGAISASYSFGSRFGDGGGSNPEELLAAAEAACYSMALAAALGKAGHSPERVHTAAACTIEKEGEGFAIKKMRLEVSANVPGVDEQTFQRVAEQTKRECLVSRALSIPIELEAALE